MGSHVDAPFCSDSNSPKSARARSEAKRASLCSTRLPVLIVGCSSGKGLEGVRLSTSSHSQKKPNCTDTTPEAAPASPVGDSPSAKVSQAGRPCTDHRGDAWFCSGRSWNYVGPTTNMFNGSFIPCIWAHPVDEGPLEIRIPKVTLGQALVGHHGLADGAVDGFAGGAPVQLEIAVNGQVVEKLVRPNQKGWVGFRVDTSSHAGRQAELKLTISTARAGGRHYCFDARIERR
jgi:hypothetical protein